MRRDWFVGGHRRWLSWPTMQLEGFFLIVGGTRFWRACGLVYRSRCAEQKLNTFELVKDLGLAVEMSVDYREGGDDLVVAEEVERGVRSVIVMVYDNEVRKRVKEMGENSRKALMEGGSSFASLSWLI
ncbi:hypothetical protein HHK36_022340 [Tetracentron sinense]|uniref:Uncharacterized protein n=1 Tax=Tetracentron sinense TaxID=13715 RepID=A0A834YPM8_TETSI|nr:hypothetical protein HHK36_022340 [Tetracentron sinense]